MRARRTAVRGFTLLELLAAITIFGLIASLVLVDLDRATDRALTSVRARELRVLAERRLGTVMTFEAEYDDLYDRQGFDDFDRDLWDGWEWDLGIRDVVVFGISNDEQAEYLFGEPEEDEEEDTTGATPGAGDREGETQFLRELTLTVRAPAIEGETSDSVTIVTFAPLVEHSASGPPASAPGGN